LGAVAVAVGMALIILGLLLQEQAVVALAAMVLAPLVATQQMVLAVAVAVAMPPTRMAVEEVTG
jgi:hypothetical protein